MTTSSVPQHARRSFPAGAVGLQQYTFCALNATGQLIVPASAGVFAVVLDDAPSIPASTFHASGDYYTGGYVIGVNYGCVLGFGRQKVVAGGTLSVGAPVETNTSGQAVASSTTAHVILGWTMTAAVANDLVEVLLAYSIHP